MSKSVDKLREENAKVRQELDRIRVEMSDELAARNKVPQNLAVSKICAYAVNRACSLVCFSLQLSESRLLKKTLL